MDVGRATVYCVATFLSCQASLYKIDVVFSSTTLFLDSTTQSKQQVGYSGLQSFLDSKDY